ncbi:GL12990 [Drosophila persimilis]|uniref:GL12990 n=1 Tax=Drosophila persimilis TaxID=7234 RepID=B4GVD6_DROPE|nr:GL12990 [Drosophila persimilis]
MEHHTYAKSDAKSWTVEQTRRLVTKRINADHMFKKPSLRNEREWKHCSRYYQLMEKRLKLLGRALSKMLIPLATFLDVQIEVSDLEELFAADSEPSPVGSVSSTDEDSNQ